MKINKICAFMFLVSFFILTMPDHINASAATTMVLQNDGTSNIKKKLLEAEKHITNGNYIEAEKIIKTCLAFDENNQEAKRLLKECMSKIHQRFVGACNTGTKKALEDFISKYPNSEDADAARKRIKDYDLWQNAKDKNTINSYNSYLSNSTIRVYEKEAIQAIKNIQMEEAWENCKGSNSEDMLNAFIREYPSSKYNDEANFELNVLKGERYYSKKEYNVAIIFYDEANKVRALQGLPAQHQIDCREQKNKAISKAKLYQYVLPKRKSQKHRFMFGWNIFHIDYMNDVMTVGSGVRFRVGDWSDAVNLLFGAEYSCIMYFNSKSDYYYKKPVQTETQAIELPVGLRFNLFKTGRRSKFYIGCNGAFGFNFLDGRDFNINKRTISIDPQLGFASKHVDFGIYFKCYLKNYGIFTNTRVHDQRGGCFLTWYM